jgi:hypothetical protein
MHSALILFNNIGVFVGFRAGNKISPLLINSCLSLCLVCILSILSPLSAQAGNGGAATIKKAEISVQDNIYILSADITYHLSKNAQEALQNGVPLFWVVRVKISQHRPVLWDKTLVEIAIRYRLQYLALLNMYRVRNENNGLINNFSTLAAAMDLMSKIRGVQLINKAALSHEKLYFAAIKVEFDREALPLPLRPITYLNPQWYLSSDWTVWPLEK